MSGQPFALLLLLVSPLVSEQSASEEALVAGQALRWSMRGLAPFEKEAARLKAVRCFRVGVFAPGSAESRSQCALRSGELLNAGGLRETAGRDLMVGVGLAAGEWSARCALIVGELFLAEGRGAEALLVLSGVAHSRAPTKLIERAAVLTGGAFDSLGEEAIAVKLWRSVAEDGVTPSHRFDAFERWGQRLLELGDLEGAAGVLSRCRFTLEEIALELTATGRAIRELLSQSSLARSIHRAVTLRHRKSLRTRSGQLSNSPSDGEL